MTTHIKSIDDLTPLIGTHLGYSDYHTVTQEQVNLFADATGDHQWIHIDLIPVLLGSVMKVEGVALGVNYGTNKVRFTSPVPVGSQIRAGATLASVEAVAGGVQVALDVLVEVKDAPKPSCVAQVVFRYYS
jgi:acyl dehydratase